MSGYTTYDFTLDKCCNVILTISGNIHTVYLDGSVILQTTSDTNVLSVYNQISHLFIGTAGDLSYGFTGNVDDFKIFNRTLLSSDVSSIYWLNAVSAMNLPPVTSNY